MEFHRHYSFWEHRKISFQFDSGMTLVALLNRRLVVVFHVDRQPDKSDRGNPVRFSIDHKYIFFRQATHWALRLLMNVDCVSVKAGEVHLGMSI